MTSSHRILVLGGTSWLGGTVARIAVALGAEVTCLARGESGSVPEGARHVVADRWQADAYAGVADAEWDAVLDVSWQPALVRSALAALAGRTGHWTYVSSCSVYRDWTMVLPDETAPLVDPWTGTGAVGVEDYPGAKVACENAVMAAVPAERLLVARAGLIAGYGDRSDRFGYWPARFARDSDEDTVLVPPKHTDAQVIDVDDLAGWLVRCGVEGTASVVDAVGEPLSMAELLAACAAVTGHDPRLVEGSDAWLLEHGVAPWMGPESLPVWLPRGPDGDLLNRRNDKARSAGLVPRPLTDTVTAALAWERELGLERTDRRAGLSRGRERELLAALSAGR